MGSEPTACTLQVNLHPLDAPHVVHTLPHQLRTLSAQVDEVLLTVDLLRAQSSRYRVAGYDEKRRQLDRVLEDACAAEPKARVVQVDYDPATVQQVAEGFLGGAPMPRTAENGSPFYAYLYGIHAARHDHVLHIDSDMLFGGGSRTWVGEAVDRLRQDRSVFACNPLGGPPTQDGRLANHDSERLPAPYPAYRFPTVSTRVLLFDRSRFTSGELRVPLLKARGLTRLNASLNYLPPVLALEDCLSAMMRANGLLRLDFLGEAPGLWSLHPPYRSEAFYSELPALVAAVETGAVPEAQRGDFDMNDSMVDWSAARAALTRRRKVRRRLEYAVAGLRARAADLRASSPG